MLKRILLIGIMIIFVFPCYLGIHLSYAHDTAQSNTLEITKEQALHLARTLIAIPADFYLEEIKSIEILGWDQKTGAKWHIQMANAKNERITIQIDRQTGNITSFFRNKPLHLQSTDFPPRIDLQQAKQIATKWLAEAKFPYLTQIETEVGNIRYFRNPLTSYFSYTFQFHRVIQGIPFPQHGVNMAVSPTGEVISFDCTWDALTTFQPYAPVLDEKQATEQLTSKMPYYLQYRLPEQELGAKIPFIEATYAPYSIDARTGQVRNHNHETTSLFTFQSITTKPITKAYKRKTQMSRKQIIEQIKEVFGIPKQFELETSYQVTASEENSNSYWQFQWVKQPNESDTTKQTMPIAISASYDLHKNQITAFSYNHEHAPENVEASSISYEQAKHKAIEIIKQQIPHLTHQYVLSPFDEFLRLPDSDKPSKQWNFRFIRVAHGVLSEKDMIQIGIDKVTGRIEHYEMKTSPYIIPQVPQKLINQQEAKNLLSKRYTVNLVYVLPPSASQAILVYQYVLKNPYQEIFLDASNGKWRKRETGQLTALNSKSADNESQVHIHPDLKYMYDYEVFAEPIHLNDAEKSLTWREMIKMLVVAIKQSDSFPAHWVARRGEKLVNATNPDHFADEPFSEQAEQMGILSSRLNSDLNKEVTREQFATSLVKALGYSRLTPYASIFNSEFTDKTMISHLGDVAIVTGLGIMNTIEGAFHPQQTISRMEAATSVLRFIQKRQQLQN